MRLPISGALNVFGSRIQVFDETNTRNARGEGVRTVSVNRLIRGIIQPAGDKLTALLPQGSRTDGAVVLHTSAPVTACDLSGAVGASGVQTYVRHAGEIWRVWGLQNWAPHSNIKRYLCTKHDRTD